jgi:hypothetical protein
MYSAPNFEQQQQEIVAYGLAGGGEDIYSIKT